MLNPDLFSSCLSARRRRKRGLTPFYGTGWAANTPAGHGPAQYNPQYPNQQQQPQYGQESQQQNQGWGQQGGYYNQNQTQGGYGANQGYYGGQQTGATELQQPPNAYRGGDQVYEPPSGPPPAKDGIVR
jgi:Chitin synthesis regulation, resistance to Congo red